jgi:hypothetical protein
MMSSPSVLEYARYHRLTIDARSECTLTQVDHKLFHACDGDLQNPPALDYDKLLRDDKLQLSHTAGHLLAECLQSPPRPHWTEVLTDHNSMRKLRMEMPMLISDHERDMKWFKKGLDLRKLTRDFARGRNPERDSTDAFSGDLARCKQLSSAMREEIGCERLETAFEVMKYLAACTGDDWTEQHMKEIIAEDLKPSHVYTTECQTLITLD